MNTSQKTKRLTVSAIMLATAVILALISSPIPPLPFGGSFTIASMLPIVLIAYMYITL